VRQPPALEHGAREGHHRQAALERLHADGVRAVQGAVQVQVAHLRKPGQVGLPGGVPREQQPRGRHAPGGGLGLESAPPRPRRRSVGVAAKRVGSTAAGNRASRLAHAPKDGGFEAFPPAQVHKDEAAGGGGGGGGDWQPGRRPAAGGWRVAGGPPAAAGPAGPPAPTRARPRPARAPRRGPRVLGRA
jgi:hypothetical protein